MALPFTVVFEPPSRSELRALLRGRWLWVAAGVLALAVGCVAYVVVSASRAEALATTAGVPLTIHSRPSGVAVWLDGRQAGHTPASAHVSPGAHRVELRDSQALEAPYTLDVGDAGAQLDVALWRRQPLTTRLRSTLPGADVLDARLGAGAEVVLTLADGPSGTLQAWRLGGPSVPPELLVAGVAGPRLAVAPDGRQVAFVGPAFGPPVPALAADSTARWVWLVPSAGDSTDPTRAPLAVWQAPPSESLLDVGWTPDQHGLLVLSAVHGLGSTQHRLWLVDPTMAVAARVLVTLPSSIAPGAYAWSPDSRRVAFLAYADALTALCVLDLATTEFRYVADLESPERGPSSYPPATWSANGQRLLFVAPPQQPSSTPARWFQPSPRRVLYQLDGASATPRQVAEADADVPLWREDGQPLFVGRGQPGAPLGVYAVASGGSSERLLDLPLGASEILTGQWHAGQARLLLASRATGETVRWLVQLGLDGAELP